MRRASVLRVVVAASTIAACIGYVAHESSTAQEDVVFPGAVAFANTPVGSSSNRLITISPASGEQNDVVQTIVETSPGCPDFSLMFPQGPLPAPVTSVCDMPIDQGTNGSGSGSGSQVCGSFTTQSYTFAASFTPSFAGTQTCVLQVTVSGSTSTITLSGTGQPPPVDIQVETGTTAGTTTRCAMCNLDFGQANVNQNSNPLFVKVINTGSGMATITNVTASGRFNIASGQTTNKMLGPNGFEVYSITCNPLVDGQTETGTLTINDTDPKGPRSVALKCVGINSVLDLSTGALGLSTRVLESTSEGLTLTNKGGALMTISSVTFQAPGGGAPPAGLSTTLAVGNTVTQSGGIRNVNVTFLPVAPTPEAVMPPIAQLVIGFNADADKRTVNITGPALDTTLSLSPTGPGGTADLGTICVGPEHLQSFTLLASGKAGFKVTQIEPAGDFTVRNVSTPTPAILPPNGQKPITFDVAVTPTVPKLLIGSVTLHTDIPTQPDQEPVFVTANAIQSGASVSPTGPVDFGTVKVGESSAEPITISLTNCNTSDLTITGAGITGDQDFVIATDPGTNVAANGTADFKIVLTPHFGGVKIGALEIQHADGIASVALIGNGDGPAEELPGNPRDSYYACDVGGASGVWPVIAVFWLARRRRR